MFYFCFFKQKTAYEMRISDWSSDVCSSDLELLANRLVSPYRATVLLTHLHWDHIQGLPFFTPVFRPDAVIDIHGPRQDEGPLVDVFTGVMRPPYFQLGRASCRERVCQYV